MKKMKNAGKKVVSAVLLAALLASAVPVNAAALEPGKSVQTLTEELETVIEPNLTEDIEESEDIASDDPVSDETGTETDDPVSDVPDAKSPSESADESTETEQAEVDMDSPDSSEKSSYKTNNDESADNSKNAKMPKTVDSSDTTLLSESLYQGDDDGPEDEGTYIPAEPEQYEDSIVCEDFEYVLRDESAVVTGYTGSDKEIVIPEKLDDYTVTKIGDRAFYGKSFISVTIPGTVTAIGVETFAGCQFIWSEDVDDDLYGIFLSDSLIEIGERAFKGMNPDHIPTPGITIPASIRTIGREAFQDSFSDISFADGLEKVPDYALYKSSPIHRIALPETVTEIGKYAFYKCTDLYEFSWNNDIKTIGKCAFYGCTSLRAAYSGTNSYHSDSIEMPENLEKIGDYAFAGWGPEDENDDYGPDEVPGNVSFEMPWNLERFPRNIFFGTHIVSLSLPYNIEHLYTDEFGGYIDYSDSEFGPLGDWYVGHIDFRSDGVSAYLCKGMYMLESINVPGDIKAIGEEAFAGCRRLHYINGGDDFSQGYDVYGKRFENLTYIGDRAFKDCTIDWEYLYLSDFEYIGEEAFADLRIGTVYFPQFIFDVDYKAKAYERGELYRLGYGAFQRTQKIVFADGSTFIPDYACSGDIIFEEIVIPDTIEEIGKYAFWKTYCPEELSVPESVKRIGEGAFKEAYPVIANIPAQVTDISDYAYYGCTFKNGVGIPSAVTSIGKYAFSDCRIDSVVIPSSVTELSEGVLKGAEFDSLSLHNNIYSIGDSAFAESNITEIAIPSSVYSIGQDVFLSCNNLTSVSFPGGLGEIPNRICFRCGKLSNITLSYGITSIGEEAFYECKKLVNVSLPDSVTEIGNNAFANTGLESVKFGKNISKIGDSAFIKTALTRVEIPKSVYSLGSDAFSYCTKLISVKLSDGITEIPLSIFFGCTSLKEIEIPDGYTRIREGAFYGCNALSTIRIPLSLVSVDRAAFKNSGLKIIKYPGTVEDYKNIRIGSDNYPFLSATKHYMSSDDESTPGVILSATSVTLEVGDTKKLYSVVYPRKTDNQRVTWTSTDTKVATVDDVGMITANSVGRATIQARSGDGFIGNCYVSVTNGGLSIKNLGFDDGTPRITVPEDIPIYGGKDFSVGMPLELPITVIWEDGYVKIGINVSGDVLSGDNRTGLHGGENWKSFKEEWEEFTDDVRKARQLTTKDLRWFDSVQARQNLRANIPGVKGKVSVGAAGYMEAFWTEGQNKLQGELLLMIEGSETFTGQFTLVGVPVTVLFTVGANGTLMAEVGYDFQNAKWYGDAQLISTFMIDLFFGAGAGDWLSAGVYGKASASSTIVLMSSEKHSTPLKDWSLSGQAGLRAYFAKKSASLKILGETYDIYKDFKKVDHSKKKTSSLDSGGQSVELDSSGRQFYVSSVETTDGLLYSSAADDGTVVYDAYNAAKPSFVSSDDATMLVYVTDDKDRGLLDQSMLVYSIYDRASGTYGEARAVLDDGSADYEPVVYSTGNDIYVAWLDSTRIYGPGEDTELQNYTGAFKLHVARYNPETGSFDDLGTMQDKNVSSYTYLARFVETEAGLELVYVENKDNRLFGLSDNNSIIRCRLEDGEWKKIESIDSLKAVSSLAAMDYGDGQLVYVYVIDKDNDLSTNEQVLFGVHPEENIESDVEGVCNVDIKVLPGDSFPSVVANIDGGLFVFGDGGFEEVLPKGTMNKDSKFEISGDRIYFLINGDENRNIGVATYNMNEWGTTLLTQENDYVDYFSVMGDKICYLCNDVNIGEGTDFAITSRIKVLNGTDITDVELEDVDYSPSSASAGNKFFTYPYIKNNGTNRLNDVRAIVTYNGQEIASEDVSVNLMPGEVQPIEFSFVMPDEMNDGGDFEIKVTAPDEADYSNNNKVISLKKADLGVHAIYDDTGDVPYVVISVENKGHLDSNMTVTVKDEEENIIYEETGKVQAGQLVVYKEEYVADKKQVLTIEVTGDADEFYMMNNKTQVTAGKDSQEADPSGDPSDEPETEPEKEDAFAVKFVWNASSPYSGLCYNSDAKRFETVFTGNKIMPEVIVNGYDRRLTEGVDYTISYSNNLNANDKKPATVTITGKGNYAGKKKLEFYIVKADLGLLGLWDMLTVQDEVRIQSGKKASVNIAYGDYTLKSSDYTLSNTKAIKQDTQIDVIGKGNFTGTLTGINVHVLSAAEVKSLTIKAVVKAGKRTYDGTKQTLSVASPEEGGEITVTAGTSKDVLREGDDFEVSYVNNDKAGSAKVIIKGNNGYLGTVTKTFAIAPDKTSQMESSLNDGSEPIYYDPTGVKPEILVKVFRNNTYTELDQGIDYTVSYSANKKAGTGKYTVKFIGNYKGHAAIKNKTFEILPAPFDAADIYCADKVYNKPGKYMSAPMVMIGTRLLGKNDVNVQYYVGKVDPANEITSKNKTKISLADGETSKEIFVVVTGKGNYEGTSITTSYKVYKADKSKVDLSKAKIVAKDKNAKGKDVAVSAQVYTEVKVTPQIRVLIKNGKNWEEVDSTSYSVNYVNNVNKGSATIIVNGKGDKAVGSISARFKIGTRNLGIFSFLFW